MQHITLEIEHWYQIFPVWEKVYQFQKFLNHLWLHNVLSLSTYKQIVNYLQCTV